MATPLTRGTSKEYTFPVRAGISSMPSDGVVTLTTTFPFRFSLTSQVIKFVLKQTAERAIFVSRLPKASLLINKFLSCCLTNVYRVMLNIELDL